jgi:hypothetical protein
METGEIGGVDMKAALLLRLEYQLDFLYVSHLTLSLSLRQARN